MNDIISLSQLNDILFRHDLTNVGFKSVGDEYLGDSIIISHKINVFVNRFGKTDYYAFVEFIKDTFDESYKKDFIIPVDMINEIIRITKIGK